MDSKAKDLAAADRVAPRPERILVSFDLFAGAREVGILHQGTLYRLSMTKQGKLILTK